MVNFRIFVYLRIFDLINSIFISKKNLNEKIIFILKKTLKKNFIFLTSMGRVAFLYIILFLKKKYPNKNEIIISSYNLPVMIDILRNLKLKIILINPEVSSGAYNINEIKKKISKKTLALVFTNFFNTYENIITIKNYCKKRNVSMIEDSAIYFDNYKQKKNKKIYAGSIGDFSILSFNIMKSVSALYGGAIVTNNKEFQKFFLDQKFNKFPFFLIIKQILIFFILKFMSIKFLYNNFFIYFIKLIYLKKINFFLKLFYPLLKKKLKHIPNYYFSLMPILVKKLLYLQLINIKERKKNFEFRKNKNIYYYEKLSKKIDKRFITLFDLKDFNFQNFLDFPVKVKNKNKLLNYMLKKGIELRKYHYINTNSKYKKNLGNQVVCLPNGRKISKRYIDYIIKHLNLFYMQNEYTRTSS